MRIEHLRRWHWVLISLLLGTAVAVPWVSLDTWDTAHLNGINQQENFERLLKMKTAEGQPLAQKIVVYPYYPDGSHVITLEAPANWERIMRFSQDAGGRSMFARMFGGGMAAPRPADPRAYYFKAPVPYVPVTMQFTNPPAEPTVLTLLEQIANENPDLPLTWKFAWWQTRKWIFAMCLGASLVIVGGIWPTLVNVLAFGSLRRPPEEKSKSAGLWRYKPKKTETAKVATGPTEQDMDELRRLEAELEAKLAGNTISTGPQTACDEAAGPAAAAAPVKKLQTAPLEIAAPEQPKEQKAFGVDREDFYPTEVHGKHKRKP